MSNYNNLVLGDVVQLKSGGPRMVVNSLVEGTETVGCIWFAQNKVFLVGDVETQFNHVDSWDFHSKSLIRVE